MFTMHRDSPGLAKRFLSLYYAATVLFLLLDYLWSLNVRVAFLDGWPNWRIVYYVACFACFLAMRRWPAWTSTIAAAESLINICGLILSMGARVLVPVDPTFEELQPLTIFELQNFLLSGAVGYAAWRYRSQEMFSDLSGRSE